ncbi:MAG: polymerase [Patescibacteria group bacterium]|nr:polymerase [Patescibacteria group bacterium]
MMTNSQIATLLRHVAASYTIQNEAKFRFQILAYQKAADAIESSPTEIKDYIASNSLDSLPGIGESMKKYLEELIETGKVSHFEVILKDMPEAFFPLLDIPSFGPKKAFKLVSYFKFKDKNTVLDELIEKARNNEIASIEGFGEKSQEDIIQAITEFHQGVNKNSRMVLPFAQEIADKMLDYLKKSSAVEKVYTLGSLRRQKETIGDVDIAVASLHPKEVIEHFCAYPYKDRIIERGEASASLLISGGKHIDLMVQPPDRFGSLLQHFTGSKEHNVKLREFALKKGLSLSEYGIKRKGSDTVDAYSTEESFYSALGLSYIEPEIRENIGEIDLAEKNNLPKLITLNDIKGDFHLHSNYPIEPSHDMGRNSMEEMVENAISLGYQYMGFSEHNPSVSKHTSPQTALLLEKRYKKIEQINEKYKKDIRVYSLLEVDILSNGDIAIDIIAFDYLDAFLVSIHSSFSMPRDKMTERILKGLSHPKAKILSHPTTRLIGKRPGIDVDWDKVFDFCHKNNKAMEINSFPQRLDLPDSLVRQAKTHGVKFMIDTDSHATEHMSLMRYGISVARRAMTTPDDILNSWEYNKFNDWLLNS